MSAKLAAQTQKTAGIPNGMRTATVTAVSGGKVTISVSGGSFSSGVGVVTSYAPRVGDVVAVFRQDSSWLILGPTSAANAWKTFAALGYAGNWTDLGAGFPLGQYRVAADEVKMVGALNTTTIPGTGQLVVSGLPAPTSSIVILAAMGTTRVRVQVDTLGTLRVYDASASGPLQFSFAYPLDSL